MPKIRLEDVTMIYPFQKVTGLFNRKEKQLLLDQQKAMPYTSNEGVIALQHFSAVIEQGQFVVVLGPSGSGKSTLLRIIAGLERPPVGKVFFGNDDFTDVRPQDRDVAMVFQNYSLYPNQTVYQNIAFPLEVKHTPREEIDEQVNQICQLLGLDDKLDRLPQELSGGEKQRVAIARAMIKKPAVLLLDEPLSNLDVLIRRSLRQQLKKLHQAYKTTFIYVTHDQYDAMSLAERVIILKDGIVQMDDTVANFYNHPVNRFCGEFMGFPAMNIFEDVKIEKNGTFTILGQKFELTSQQKKQLKTGVIDVGLRATNISIGGGIAAEVEYAEEIEADCLVHLICQEQKLTAVIRSRPDGSLAYSPKDRVHISFDRENLHIFDKNGRRL